MIFYTRSCAYLANSINLPRGNVTVRECKDGELSVKIEDDVAEKTVWVCASTISPADTILETLFLLDALLRAGAYIKLLFVYFGYARQDRYFSGQSVSCEVIFRCLQQFKIKDLHVLHMHNPHICSFLPFYNQIPWPFFFECARDIDLIVAPDDGATFLAQETARRCNKPYAVIPKIRTVKEEVEARTITYNVAGKKILIVDDMIVTGATIITLSEALYAHGAAKIEVAATHGLFSADAYACIEESPIEKIFVTNSLRQRQLSAKIMVEDIGSFLETIMK